MKIALEGTRALTWIFVFYLFWVSADCLFWITRKSNSTPALAERFESAWPTLVIGLLLVLPYWKISGRKLRMASLTLFGIASLACVMWSVGGIIEVLDGEDYRSTLPIALFTIIAVGGNFYLVAFRKEPNQTSEPTRGTGP